MKRIFISLWSGLIGLLLITLVQSSGIPVSDASTVPPTAIDPALLHTLQVRYKTLAKQLTQLMPTQAYILVDTARNHLYIKRG